MAYNSQFYWGSFPCFILCVVLLLFHIDGRVLLAKIILKRSIRASFAGGPVTCFFSISVPEAVSSWRRAVLACSRVW